MSSSRDRIATPDGKRRYVRALFATIADRYDFITVAAVVRQDRRWKRRLDRRWRRRAPAPRALDLATGTGDIAFALAARGARVVGLDVTLRMIELARDKAPRPRPRAVRDFLVGDMLALPFPAASFDIVTTGYGLRNVPDLATAIDEIGRVLDARRPGAVARLQPAGERVVRAVYLAYLTVVGGDARLAAAPRSRHLSLHSGVDSAAIPAPRRSARLFEARGFSRVRHYPRARRADGHSPCHLET